MLSAYDCTMLVMVVLSVMSLMYIKHIKCPNTDPCDTILNIDFQYERSSAATTCLCQSVLYPVDCAIPDSMGLSFRYTQ